ncbi:prepilin-type N-terminal cleavage/methylation domain-containing protein [Bacillus lacus]|uniref:Prepilin-type N-terminal cleavage/methylation domain-containing protein n=1 Tax=Metabacillus lacus TaxID=1983721 RepID=A0A7X2IXU0_9BACI|nr:prepilin-type N-terminal cleavage/methylation domain-containing protein [Metabacillus lacus]MRX71442.1 prepilin-type N-terminal cleavage/methylation domain-containing protein [Metabacillus lacus]
MKKSGNIFNQQGLTVIELLAAITISTIALASIYGVFQMGVQAYSKTAAEQELRDEGDYILSLILSDLYAAKIDTVENCTKTESEFCFKIVNDHELSISSLNSSLVEKKGKEKPSTITYLVSQSSIKRQEQSEKETTERIISSSNVQISSLNSSLSCTDSRLSGSGSSKKQCSSGVITLRLLFQKGRAEHIEFESKFGF